MTAYKSKWHSHTSPPDVISYYLNEQKRNGDTCILHKNCKNRMELFSDAKQKDSGINTMETQFCHVRVTLEERLYDNAIGNADNAK